MVVQLIADPVTGVLAWDHGYRSSQYLILSHLLHSVDTTKCSQYAMLALPPTIHVNVHIYRAYVSTAEETF